MTTNVTCYGGNNGTACSSIEGVASFSATMLNSSTGVYVGFQQMVGIDPNLVKVMPPPGGTITISNNNLTFSSASSGRFCFYGLSAGVYILEVTDNQNGGCLTTAEFTIQEPRPLELRETHFFHGCNDEVFIDLTATTEGGVGDYVFTLTIDQSVYNVSSGEFVNISTEGQTSATLAVTDGNLCTTSLAISIANNIPNNIQVIPGTVPPSCYGVCDGKLYVNISGGKSKYLVTVQSDISTNTTSEYAQMMCLGEDGCNASAVLEGLCAGDYTISVADAGGCTYQTIVSITAPERITYDNLVVTNPSCNNCCNGCVEVETITGYVRQPGLIRDLTVTLCTLPEGQPAPTPVVVGINQNAQVYGLPVQFCGLRGGTYELCISDEYGCEKKVQFGVQPPTPFQIII